MRNQPMKRASNGQVGKKVMMVRCRIVCPSRFMTALQQLASIYPSPIQRAPQSSRTPELALSYTLRILSFLLQLLLQSYKEGERKRCASFLVQQ